MVGFVIGLIFVSVSLSYIFKKDIEYIIPLGVFVSIAVMYFFAVFGALRAGVYVLYGIAFLGFAYFVYAIIKYKRDFLSSISFTPIAIFSVFTLISLWAQWGRVLSYWDEFSHWGRVVKDIVYNNKLSAHPDSMVFFQNYPPATALLQYLFIKIRGAFVEAEILHAMNIIYFALMMPLFRNLDKKNIFKIVVIILIVLILPTGFYFNMHSAIYVDGLLAAIFAYMLIIYFFDKPTKFTFVNLALAAFVLAILKPSGIGIAAMALIVIYADFIYASKKHRKSYFAEDSKVFKILLVILPIIFIAAGDISWDSYLQANNANIVFDTTKLTFNQMADVFIRFNGTDAQNEILVTFLDAFTTTLKTKDAVDTINFIVDVPPFTYLAVFIVMGTIFWYRQDDKEKRKRILVAILSLVFVCVIFLASLLVSYLFMFTEYEGLGLAAYTRYIGTYFMVLEIMIAAYILLGRKGDDIKVAKVPSYVLFLLVLLLVTGIEPFLNTTVLAPMHNQYAKLSRARFSDIQNIDEYVEDDENVYYLDVGSKGFSYWVSSYEVYPIVLSRDYSIGMNEYYGGDVWTVVIPPDEWEKILYDEYDYVYIYSTEYTFAEDYGHLFGGAENVSNLSLYRVEKLNDGSVGLNKVR